MGTGARRARSTRTIRRRWRGCTAGGSCCGRSPSPTSCVAEVRLRNEDWLIPWEPARLPGSPDATRDRDAFAVRCHARDRERQAGTGYGFGIFIGERLPARSTSTPCSAVRCNAHVGYWIDEACAGRGYMPESVVVLARSHSTTSPSPPAGEHHPPQPQQPQGWRWARTARRGHRDPLPGDQRGLGGPRPLRVHGRGVEGPPARAERSVARPPGGLTVRTSC